MFSFKLFSATGIMPAYVKEYHVFNMATWCTFWETCHSFRFITYKKYFYSKGLKANFGFGKYTENWEFVTIFTKFEHIFCFFLPCMKCCVDVDKVIEISCNNEFRCHSNIMLFKIHVSKFVTLTGVFFWLFTQAHRWPNDSDHWF